MIVLKDETGNFLIAFIQHCLKHGVPLGFNEMNQILGLLDEISTSARNNSSDKDIAKALNEEAPVDADNIIQFT